MGNSDGSARSLSDILTELESRLSTCTPEEKQKVLASITKIAVSLNSARTQPVPEVRPDIRDDGFWQFDPPREKKYRRPDFDTPPGSYDVSISGSHDPSRAQQPEPIPAKGTLPDGNVRKPLSDHQTIPSDAADSVVRKYGFSHEGLLSYVTVRSRTTDNLYSHFSRDVALSHRSAPESEFRSLAPVPFQSYVPQFSHMSSQQIEYYRAWREEVRNGSYPSCDLSYIILYIYEIINLPDIIPPQKGVKILSSLWIAYRGAYPRIDGFLGEWMADYCLIHETPLPKALLPYIPRIVPKSQFKEFYLHPLLILARSEEKNNVSLFGRAVMETLSDYDYTQSKCYLPNRDFYDAELPYLLGKFITRAVSGSIPPLSLDRVYSLTRESYSGAIVSPGIKMRIDLSFLSFSRKAESRQVITAAVKECENRIRCVLGIKSKLKTDPLPAEIQYSLTAALNSVYPLTARTQNQEPDYMEYYEPESTGYDYDSAAELEYSSWTNTERLTGEDLISPSPEESADEDLPVGAIVSAEPAADTESSMSASDSPDGRITETRDQDMTVKGAVRAALDGSFALFCRENRLNEGNTADLVNSLFLDILGDVIIEPDASGTSYNLVEDYRKDIEEWLLTF